jgi:putative hydrolase of the HAD superfamily
LKFKHLFFDLDHTLWDARANTEEALAELYISNGLPEKGIKLQEEFIEKYQQINAQFWNEYSKGRISKNTLRYKRFLLTLRHFGINDYDLSYSLSEQYTDLAPGKSKVQPHTHQVLDYLLTRYSLHILTNGFQDAQHRKIKASGLEPYFNHVITAEKAGTKKPDKAIFQYSADLVKAQLSECLMIGDNLETDIIGARSAGMNQVYFNLENRKHNEKIDHEITSLLELKKIL